MDRLLVDSLLVDRLLAGRFLVGRLLVGRLLVRRLLVGTFPQRYCRLVDIVEDLIHQNDIFQQLLL